MSGGSSREDPVHSHEQIPQRGYGDGHGNYGPRGKGKSYGLAAYYAAKGAKGYAPPQASPYGYAPDGRWSYGYGPLQYFRDGEWGYPEDMGYGPMPRIRVPGSPPTHGGKGKGKGAPTHGGSPSPARKGKGEGKSPWALLEQQAEEGQGDGVSNGSSQLSRSSRQAGGQWANRRIRREEASRSRSRSQQPEVVINLDADELMETEEAPPADHAGTPASGMTYSPATPAPVTPEHLSQLGFGIDMDDAKTIHAHMESVQCMIIALKGKTDEYSMKFRAGLECDLHRLRVRKTKLKPLEDQNAILEALVEKRTTHFTQTEHNVQVAISSMEDAKKSLMVAQQQLLQVRAQKAEADAKVVASKAAAQRDAEMPDNLKSVQKLQDLVCLLPNGMSDGFGQCLKMLEELLQQASASTVTTTSTLDEIGSDFSAGMDHIYVPQFPRGEQEQTAEATLGTSANPSAAEREGTPPPRGRARSAEPERSPATRSRTHSLSRSRTPGYCGKPESLEEHFPAGNRSLSAPHES